MTRTQRLESILEKCAKALATETGGKKGITPKQFEDSVESCLKKACEKTEFEGQVVAEFGQKFPDISFQEGVYGVEVKLSKNQHLQTIGNSVLEGTRREGIDEIYIMFGSFAKEREPRILWRKYEECCVDIAVTHYPRYKINMEARRGESIFDKIGVPYAKLRKLKQKEILDVFRKHYRKQNASLWWLGRVDEEEDYVPAAFNFLNEMPDAERRKILQEGFVYFPELVGDDNHKKYRGFVEWLLRKNIVCHNARDFFSSGGQVTRYVGGVRYARITKAVAKLCDELDGIKGELQNADPENIMHYWDLETKPRSANWVQLEWIRRLLACLGDKPRNEAFVRANLKRVFGKKR